MNFSKNINNKKLILTILLFALAPLVLCVLAYYIRFGLSMNYYISPNQVDWGTFGDFIGGVLNPIYAFLAFICVIYTVILQKIQLDDIKINQKLVELQQLICSVSETIDKVIFEQKYKYDSKDTNLFTLLKSLSDDSIRCELYPNDPLSLIYDDIKSKMIDYMSFDLVYINEQLSHLIWCIDKYEKNKGSNDIKEFYIGKYRNIVFMIKQIGFTSLDEVVEYFNVCDVKRKIVSAVTSHDQ